VGGFADSDALWPATIASAAIVAVTPVAGLPADRMGRRPTLQLFGALSLLLPRGAEDWRELPRSGRSSAI